MYTNSEFILNSLKTYNEPNRYKFVITTPVIKIFYQISQMSFEKFKGISRPQDLHVHTLYSKISCTLTEYLKLCCYLYITGAVCLILSRPICPSFLNINLILFC